MRRELHGRVSSSQNNASRDSVHGFLSRSGDENLPGSTTDLGQRQLHAPDLTLVAEAILADELKLSVTIPSLTKDVPDISRARSSSVAIGDRYARTDEQIRKDA